MRDAIVLSGWTWRATNVPERLALALARLGLRVLYCENPFSRFNPQQPPHNELANGIYGFRPKLFSHRLNRFATLARWQAAGIAEQILTHAAALSLQNPILFYPCLANLVPLASVFKKQGLPVVYVCMDYPELRLDEHVRVADFVLVIPRAGYHRLKARYGNRIHRIPQPVEVSTALPTASEEPEDLARIPCPRLGYLGHPHQRLNLRLVREIFVANPDWHLVWFGACRELVLPNIHVLDWRPPDELRRLVAHLDVGIMPYDCADEREFHATPLKLFEYFLAGLPVVSTPILHLWEHQGLIYFGDTAEELSCAVTSALREPPDSPLRQLRQQVAARHSIEHLASVLAAILPLGVSHATLVETHFTGST